MYHACLEIAIHLSKLMINSLASMRSACSNFCASSVSANRKLLATPGLPVQNNSALALHACANTRFTFV